MKSKAELTAEIEQLKQQLREREREREKRAMNWGFLVVNTLLTRANLPLRSEIQARS